MKIVYFATYYPPYLRSFLERNTDFDSLDYQSQKQRIADDYFSVWGIYEKYANRLGVQAELLIANCEPMQKQWAKENDFDYDDQNWMHSIAIEQIKRIKPDAFFMGSMFNFYGEFLETIRPFCKKIFGWIACPIPKDVNLKQMELILSSSPAYVSNFRSQGIGSEMLNAAFDPDIYAKFDDTSLSRDIPVSFIGGLSKTHAERVRVLKKLCKKTPIEIWGMGLEKEHNIFKKIFSPNSIEPRYNGEVFGLEMYRILRKSKIAFNIHIAEAGEYAGNMRMYEATGMGAMLLSDYKRKSTDIFIEDKEVVYYRNEDDAIEKIKYYLEHEDERMKIAEAGHKRTMEQYNFEKNMKLMLQYFSKYL